MRKEIFEGQTIWEMANNFLGTHWVKHHTCKISSSVQNVDNTSPYLYVYKHVILNLNWPVNPRIHTTNCINLPCLSSSFLTKPSLPQLLATFLLKCFASSHFFSSCVWPFLFNLYTLSWSWSCRVVARLKAHLFPTWKTTSGNVSCHIRQIGITQIYIWLGDHFIMSIFFPIIFIFHFTLKYTYAWFPIQLSQTYNLLWLSKSKTTLSTHALT